MSDSRRSWAAPESVAAVAALLLPLSAAVAVVLRSTGTPTRRDSRARNSCTWLLLLLLLLLASCCSAWSAHALSPEAPPCAAPAPAPDAPALEPAPPPTPDPAAPALDLPCAAKRWDAEEERPGSSRQQLPVAPAAAAAAGPVKRGLAAALAHTAHIHYH